MADEKQQKTADETGVYASDDGPTIVVAAGDKIPDGYAPAAPRNKKQTSSSSGGGKKG